MTSEGQSTSHNLSSLWKFLDNEDMEGRSANQRDERRGEDQPQPQPHAQRFLRPAMYGVNRTSVESDRSQNGLQLPTFTNNRLLKVNKGRDRDRDNDEDPAKQPRRLPRTQIKDKQTHDSDSIYAMPNKTRKTEKKTQLQDQAKNSRPSNPLYSLSKKPVNHNFKTQPPPTTTTPSSNNNDKNNNNNNNNNNNGPMYFANDYDMSSTALFKRYEAGSIMSLASGGDHPPVIYHDGGRKGRIVNVVDEDNVVFAQSSSSSSSSRKRLWMKPKEGKNEGGGGCGGCCCDGCCSRRVVVAVLVAVIVVGAVVGIAVGVSLWRSNSENTDKASNDSSTNIFTTLAAGNKNSTGSVIVTTSSYNHSNNRQDAVIIFGTSTFAASTYSKRVTVPATTTTPGTGRSTGTSTLGTWTQNRQSVTNRTTFSSAVATTSRAQGSTTRASSAVWRTDTVSNSAKYGQVTTMLASSFTSRKIVPSTVTPQEVATTTTKTTTTTASVSKIDSSAKDANISLSVAAETTAAANVNGTTLVNN